MPLLTVQPTELDERIAHQIASHTDRSIERVASVATWGADEHVLVAIAAIGWLISRTSSDRERRLGNHFLACSLTTTIVPHIMKHFINQARPDRLTIIGHMKGVPLSGSAEDAFPSGHALHIGALASAATLLAPKWRPAIWGGGAFLVGTRVVLLAHWFTDILAGLAIGVGIERGLRFLTKPATSVNGHEKRRTPLAGRKRAEDCPLRPNAQPPTRQRQPTNIIPFLAQRRGKRRKNAVKPER